MNDDLRQYYPMFESIERRVLPGVTTTVRERIGLTLGITASIAVLFLPYIGGTEGWSVLVNSSAAQAESTSIVASLAVHASVVFCVVCSAAALHFCALSVTVLTAFGCAGTSCLSAATMWSRIPQSATPEPSGPGAGLVVGTIGAFVLTVLWARSALLTRVKSQQWSTNLPNTHQRRT